MRFLALWHPAKNAAPPSEKHFFEMGKLIEEMTQKGILLDTGGFVTNRTQPINEGDDPRHNIHWVNLKRLNGNPNPSKKKHFSLPFLD
jgi:hypothetical protein